MAQGTKVRGITIELGADTTGLSKALKDVNGQISSTQKQLKDVERLLKLDPKNTELLEQKQRLLNEAIDASKSKVDTLKEAQSALNTETAEGQKQYDAIEREIIACQQEQAKWSEELDKVPTKLEQFQGKLKSVSDATAVMAEKTAGISKAAAAGVAALAGMAYKAGTSADDINTLAKQYGVTTREIQKMNYAQDLIDVSTDTMLSSYAKLTKQMGAGSDVFDKLGVVIHDVHGELRDSKDVWYDTLQALSEVTNETERDVLAQEVFGKSAADLAGVIDDGGEALKTLGQEAENAGLILSQDALDGANQFNDAIDHLKGTTQQAFLEAGASLATELIPAIEKLVEWVSKLFTWLGSLDGSTLAFIGTILALVAAISPVLSLISMITGAAAALSVGTLTLIGTIGGVIAIIAAVVAAGVLLYQNWDTIKEKASQLWETIKTAFSNMLEAVTTTMGNIKDAIVEGWEAAIDYIKDLPGKAVDWGRDIINGMVEGIRKGMDTVGGAISGVATTIKNFIGFSEPEMGPLKDFHTYMPDMMQMMADGITDNTWRVEHAIADVAGGVADYSQITGRLDTLIDTAGQREKIIIQPNPSGIFKVVRDQNGIYTKSTGRSGL